MCIDALFCDAWEHLKLCLSRFKGPGPIIDVQELGQVTILQGSRRSNIDWVHPLCQIAARKSSYRDHEALIAKHIE